MQLFTIENSNGIKSLYYKLRGARLSTFSFPGREGHPADIVFRL